MDENAKAYRWAYAITTSNGREVVSGIYPSLRAREPLPPSPAHRVFLAEPHVEVGMIKDGDGSWK